MSRKRHVRDQETYASTIPSHLGIVWMMFMQPQGFLQRLRLCGLDHPERLKHTPGSERGKVNHRILVARLRILEVVVLFFMPHVAYVALYSSGYAASLDGILRSLGLSGTSLTMYLLPGFVMLCGYIYLTAFGADNGFVYGVFFGSLALAFVVDWKAAGLSGVDVFLAGCGGGVLGFLMARNYDRFIEIELRSVLRVLVVLAVVAFRIFEGEEYRTSWIAAGVGFLVAYFHLPVYAIESLLQPSLYALRKRFQVSTLQYSPVLVHELSPLPIPFLLRHIVLEYQDHPELAGRVLDACSISLAQRHLRQQALARIQVRRIRR